MNIEQLFPLKAEITQKIIDTAGLYSIAHCIGAKTLREALNGKTDRVFELYDITWGNYNGSISLEKGQILDITTEGGLNMMRVEEPQTVTFIIDKK